MRHIKQMEDIWKSLQEMEWDSCIPEEDLLKNIDFFGNFRPEINPNKNKFWITDGTDSRMIFADEKIPEGWYKGRTFEFSKSGRKSNLKQLKENNPNAKKYKIIFRDGTEQVVKQLSTWARQNGHTYGSIKSIVHRTRYNKEKQFDCYNSSTYYIKEIHKIG